MDKALELLDWIQYDCKPDELNGLHLHHCCNTIRNVIKCGGWQPIGTLKDASHKQRRRFDVWVKWDTGKEERVPDCYWHKKANAIMGINPVRQKALYWMTPTNPRRTVSGEK